MEKLQLSQKNGQNSEMSVIHVHTLLPFEISNLDMGCIAFNKLKYMNVFSANK